MVERKVKNTFHEILQGLIPFSLVIILFILSSLYIQTHIEFFKQYIGQQNIIGIAIYLSILIISIVFTPVSAMPFLPIASNIWGWYQAGIMTVFGWTVGAIIAFWIARKYGTYLVNKFIPLEKLHKVERYIPEENIFLSIIFLRMVMPFDGLSYALGLFTKIKTRLFILATFIGLIPFCLIFSYLGTLPAGFQIFGFVMAVLLLLVGLFRINKKKA